MLAFKGEIKHGDILCAWSIIHIWTKPDVEDQWWEEITFVKMESPLLALN